jgi:hypothetical protein
MKRRRDFIVTVGDAAAAWPLTVHARQPAMRMKTLSIITERRGAGSPKTGRNHPSFNRRLG